MNQKVAIIKLGAKGDVVRTMHLLPGIKEKYPNSEVYWFTKKESVEILNNSPLIKKVYSIPVVIKDNFDVLFNLDIDEEATKLAGELTAKKKYGFWSNGGFVECFNMGAQYYLNTTFDDELKKSNKKTYQEMMFSAADLSYNKQFCGITLNEESLSYAELFLKSHGLVGKKIIGLHVGASKRWPSKMWHEDNIKDFIKKVKRKGYEVLLFGGPGESEQIKNLSSDLKKDGINVLSNNSKNSDLEFASLVNSCLMIVCSDSFALHVAVSLKKKTAGLFFCTSPDEVESYGFLVKLVSPRLYDFFPEKSDLYDEPLTKSISADSVIKALGIR
ncbi:MAG: glycosyltransferase family 9 protein [Nanoarchaeota archaeon]